MDYRHQRIIGIGVIVVFAVVMVTAGGAGSAAAQEGLDVSIDAPDTATTGEEETLTASISVPDVGVQDHEEDLTLTLYEDGNQVDSKTVTVNDGESTDVMFNHTFEQSGTVEMKIEGEVTIAGQTYSDSASTNVEVQQATSIDGELSGSITAPDTATAGEESTITPEFSIPQLTGAVDGELALTLYVDGDEAASTTLSVTGGESASTDFKPIFDNPGETSVTVEAVLTVGSQTASESVSASVDVSEAGPETTSLEGAAFAVPESLEDEVETYRQDTSQDLQANSFVLATQNELYLVFTQEEPTKGYATVEGPALSRDLSTENLTYGVIAATNASFETTGTDASVQEVADNSDQYQLDLVRVNAHYRRVSTLTDPDEGTDFTLSSTSGVLIKNPQTVASVFKNVGSKARALNKDISTDQIDSILNNPTGPHLHTFSFETKFWADAEATVDAIVLDPQSTAQQFLDEYDQAGIAHAEAGEPILYVVEDTFQPQTFEDVSSIKSQADSLDGEVVETEARLYQQKISVQETLEHSTGCNEDLLEIQTPQGPVCVNVAQDNLLHAGTAWNSLPQSKEDVLLVMGVSSRHQDSPEEFEEGRYKIEGEVVSTSRINESLPQGSVLLMYDLERVGDIDYEAVQEEARNIIENRATELVSNLKEQLGTLREEEQSNRVDFEPVSIGKGKSVEIIPLEADSKGLGIEKINITAAEDISDIKLTAENIPELPTGVSDPPINADRIVNISASASSERMTKATITFNLKRNEISTEGKLVVYRHYDGEWVELETKVVAETNTEIKLDVETPGFSYFAIGAQETDSSEDGTDAGGDGDDGTDDSESTDGSDDGDGDSTDGGSTKQEEQNQDDGQEEENADDGGPGFTVIAGIIGFALFLSWQVIIRE